MNVPIGESVLGRLRPANVAAVPGVVMDNNVPRSHLSDESTATIPPAGLVEHVSPCVLADPRLTPDLLRLGIAYRLQEKALGALSKRVVRSLATGTSAPAIKPGTRLIRDWNGRTVDVLADNDGYVFDGKHYASLSAIARTVTGTAWSGPRFFGLQS